MAYSLRSIAKGSLLYTSGQVLTKASAFLLIPLYTRYLTPDDYGIVGYLQFLMAILGTILMFGFYGAQTRFFYQYKNDSRVIGEFLFSINVWLVAILLPSLLLVIFFGENIYQIIGPDDIPFHPYILIVAVTTFFSILNQLVISYWMARKEYLRTTLLQLLLFSFTTGFAIFLVVGLKMGAEGKVRALLYGHALFFLFSYIPYAKHFILRIRWSHIAYSLSFGLPIVIHLLSGVMHTSIDRAILADMVPVAQLGLYTLGYQVGMVMSIVTTSVNSAWQPSYYDLMETTDKKKDHHLRSTYNLWLIIMSMICVVGILWGGDILKLITPENFHGAERVIPYVLLGYFFHGLYYFAVSPIFFYKKTMWLPWFTGAAAAANVGLNFLLIPYFGITGAALATTISMFLQAVLVHLCGRRLHDHGFNLKKTAIISLAMMAAFIGPLYIDDMLTSYVVRATSLIVLVMLLFVSFRAEFLWIFTAVTRRVRTI